MKNLCIAYVTKTNTTKEIAIEIAKIAREKGWEAKVINFSNIESLEGYDAILIGSPINGMQWLPEAYDFVEKHKDSLKQIPISYFLVSYLMNSGSRMWKRMIDNSLNKAIKSVKPMMIGKFNGKIDAEFGTIPRLLFGVKKDTPLDLRNWDKIKSWAHEFIDTLNQMEKE